MNTVATILTLVPVAVQAVGGIESLIQFVGTLHAGGALTADDVAAIKADRALADALFDAQWKAVKARLGVL